MNSFNVPLALAMIVAGTALGEAIVLMVNEARAQGPFVIDPGTRPDGPIVIDPTVPKVKIDPPRGTVKTFRIEGPPRRSVPGKFE